MPENKGPNIIIKKCELNKEKKRPKLINLSIKQAEHPKIATKKKSILVKDDEETNTPVKTRSN